jgi:hypothetical protein
MLHYFLHLFWESVKDATTKGGWVQCEPDCHFDPQIAVSILQLHFVILNFVHLNIGSSCHHELCYWLLCHGQNKEEICIIKGCMNKQALDGPLRELVEQKCPFWGPDYLGEGWKKRLRKLFHSFFSGREEVNLHWVLITKFLPAFVFPLSALCLVYPFLKKDG